MRRRDRHGNEIRELVVRIPTALWDTLHARAGSEHTSKAEIIRRALLRYL